MYTCCSIREDTFLLFVALIFIVIAAFLRSQIIPLQAIPQSLQPRYATRRDAHAMVSPHSPVSHSGRKARLVCVGDAEAAASPPDEPALELVGAWVELATVTRLDDRPVREAPAAGDPDGQLTSPSERR